MKIDLGIVGVAALIAAGVFLAQRAERIAGPDADAVIDRILGRATS